jgi:hypothetical protein
MTTYAKLTKKQVLNLLSVAGITYTRLTARPDRTWTLYGLDDVALGKLRQRTNTTVIDQQRTEENGQPRYTIRFAFSSDPLLKTRHDEYIQAARQLLYALQARIEEDAVQTDYNWGHVGALTDVVDKLRELGPYWVGDLADETD